MNFTTKIAIQKSIHLIDYQSKIVSLGSCFAVNMAEKLDYFKFENTCNPFGIIFNPISIEKLVYRITQQLFYTENDIFFHNESWNCYEAHSELSNSNKATFLKHCLKSSLAMFLQYRKWMKLTALKEGLICLIIYCQKESQLPQYPISTNLLSKEKQLWNQYLKTKQLISLI